MEKFINQSPLFLVIICLIIGFAFLMKGADYFVEGSSSVAKRLKVPSIIIGSDDRSHGNITSRNCSQCNSVYCQ